MILVIGKENCSNCEMVKTILKNKNIQFEYLLLDDLNKNDKSNYLNMARNEGKMSLPLIIVDNKIKSLQEVVANVK